VTARVSTPENSASLEYGAAMTPGNTAQGVSQAPGSTPENKRGRRPAVLSVGSAEVLAAYGRHLSRGQFIGQSARTYLSAVRGYLAWLDGAEVDGDPLTDPAARNWAVRDYRAYLVTVAKRAPATLSKILAALDDFYVSRGLGKAEGVKRIKPPRRAPRSLDSRARTRWERAAEACGRKRDRAIALLPLFTGARIAEAAALDVGDVRMSARKGSLYLIGKGQKPREVPIPAHMREVLQAWLDERPSWPAAGTNPALFVSRRGTRLTTDAIGDVLDRIGREAGLEEHVTAHVLRHTYATDLIRGGADIVSVAELLGHESLETTRIYSRPSWEDLERVVERLAVDG
jgi:site-specific recombinase XerD